MLLNPNMQGSQMFRYSWPFHMTLEIMDLSFSEQALGNTSANLGNRSSVRTSFERKLTTSELKTEERKQKLSRYRKKKTKRNFGRKIKVLHGEVDILRCPLFKIQVLMSNILIKNIKIYSSIMISSPGFFHSMHAGRLQQTASLGSEEGLRRLKIVRSQNQSKQRYLAREKRLEASISQQQQVEF